MKTWDIIIVGGGIIGLTLAVALRRRGAAVLIVERGEPGHEASRAAGGMLVDCPLETPSALQELATASARMYPEFARELEIESGMKVDLRDQGTILFLTKEHLTNEQLGHTALGGLRAEFVSAAEIEKLEPAVRTAGFENPERCALYLKERSVDPRGLSAAAVKTAKIRGVDFSSGDAVESVEVSSGRATGVTTKKTSFRAAKVVNCAGAWAGQIPPRPIHTRPVKGQMLCLAMPSREMLKHVIRSPRAYLIPRSDGRLLVGATVEEAGFDKRTDPATIQRQRKAALELVPKLADARILEDWAGLRPGTPDALPILGATGTAGYYAATGHFRDGILLAPITAEVMAAVIEERDPGFDLAAFSPARFEPA